MELALFKQDGILFLLRWLHFFFGVIWIGLLYYFNFVQGAFMNEVDASTKSSVTQKLVPRALWWFRWGAMYTIITGVLYLTIRGHQLGGEFFYTGYGSLILVGAILGTLMWANVWFVIWPNQKVVIQSATQVAGGGAAIPEAAASAARALCASRTNVCFSIPMLFFMGAASHLSIGVDHNSNLGVFWIVVGAIVGAIELNALKGQPGPLATVKGVVTSGFVLAFGLYLIAEILL